MSDEEKAINFLRSADIDKETGDVQWHTWYKGIDKDIKKTFDIAIEALELPKDCMNFPLKSIEGLIEKIKEKCKYNNKDKLSDYSINVDELINIIEEYCRMYHIERSQ